MERGAVLHFCREILQNKRFPHFERTHSFKSFVSSVLSVVRFIRNGTLKLLLSQFDSRLPVSFLPSL